ncbi:MAG: PLP-dependent aminotransferase family protein, partial [Clostridia bacterium]|nr:PLP-dependent aminotransferase family protein [Clostridia bacterium]
MLCKEDILVDEWAPDADAGLPLYEQIRAHLERRIRSGALRMGERLPTQREMAEKWRVNRSTLIRALEELAADGYIEGRGSRGTFVSAAGQWQPAPSVWPSGAPAGARPPNRRALRLISDLERQPESILLHTPALSPELIREETRASMRRGISFLPPDAGCSEPGGLYALRSALCEHLRAQTGLRLQPENILMVSGTLQAVNLAAAGLLTPASTVLAEKPSCFHLPQALQPAGVRLRGIPVRNDGMDLSLLAQAIKQGRCALLHTVPNFHNPTGALMSEEKKQAL